MTGLEKDATYETDYFFHKCRVKSDSINYIGEIITDDAF
jgi:hypothetical protein